MAAVRNDLDEDIEFHTYERYNRCYGVEENTMSNTALLEKSASTESAYLRKLEQLSFRESEREKHRKKMFRKGGK